MPNLHFFYEYPLQNQNVFININGLGQPHPMTSMPRGNAHYYYFIMSIDDRYGYPITLDYQYCLYNGQTIDSKSVILKYPCIGNIILIRDKPSSLMQNSILPKNSITLFFYLEVPPPYSNSTQSVFIFSPFLQLSSKQSIEMQFSQSLHLWTARIEFDTSFPMPLMYHYSIKSLKNTYFGESFVRTIEFNSPIKSNFNISIHDCFWQKFEKGNLNYYFRPIQTSSYGSCYQNDSNLFDAQEADTTNFSVFYRPSENDKNAIHSVDLLIQSQNPVSLKLESSLKNNFWHNGTRIPTNFQRLTYSINNYTSPKCTLIPIDNISFSNIETRLVNSSVKTFPLALYFPLVSLKVTNSKSLMNACGTFKTIGNFSYFLSFTQISIIHLHIEKLPGSEMFLDPVQLYFPDEIYQRFISKIRMNSHVNQDIDSELLSKIDLDQELTLSDLREIKKKMVENDFNAQKNFDAFQNFKAIFDGFYKHHLQLNELEYYTQFVCYSQLFVNVQKAHLNGIQIISDVSVVDGPYNAIDSLPITSLYSTGIYLNDISKINGSGLTIEKIKQKFGDDSMIVASTFFDKKDSFYTTKNELKVKQMNKDNRGGDLINFNDKPDLCSIDKPKLWSSLMYIESQKRQYYFDSLLQLNAIEEEYKSFDKGKRDLEDLYSHLIRAQQCISASIIVDEKMSIDKDPSVLENSFIIPSFSYDSKSSFPRSYLVPKELTPLRTSSYLHNTDRSKVISDLKNHLARPSVCSAIYLNDFFFCCHLSTLTGHSVITGNDRDRRDVLAITIKDLFERKESFQMISNFLKSIQNQ